MFVRKPTPPTEVTPSSRPAPDLAAFETGVLANVGQQRVSPPSPPVPAQRPWSTDAED